jgi:hypothetical protein
MDRRFLMFSIPFSLEIATVPNTSTIGRKFNSLCDTAKHCYFKTDSQTRNP